jgi:hypothetical protein
MSILFEIETARVCLVWRAPASRARDALEGIGVYPGVLKIQPRRQDVVFERITPEPPLETPRFYEETDYRVYLKSKTGQEVSIVHPDPTTCAATRPEDNGRVVTGNINFRSNIGLSRFCVTIDGQPEFDFEIEVFPSKLDYKSDYEQLLAETRWHIAGLIFEFLRPTFRTAGPSRHHTPDGLSWLFILKHVINELEVAARFIAHRPIRALTNEEQMLKAEQIKKIDASVRRATRRGAGSGAFLTIGEMAIKQKLPHRAGSFTLDTPEHRWIASQLRIVRQRLQRLIDVESKVSEYRAFLMEPTSVKSRKHHVIEQLRSLSTRITALEKLEPFDSATSASLPGYASLQLMSAPGYMECYKQLNLLNSGLSLDSEFLNLSVKELSVLYEYWCFLTVVSMVIEKTASLPSNVDFIKHRQSGVRVTLKSGQQSSVRFNLKDGKIINVVYNKSFKQDDDAILIPQKPDIIVTVEGTGWPKLSLLLDAKYRVRSDPWITSLYNSPGPDDDAINALHRYRDAILEIEKVDLSSVPKRTVLQAAALFPYRDSDGSFTESKLWTSLQKIGIGAIPLIPTEKQYLGKWLDSVLRSGEWSLADKAISHVAIEKREDWRRAASEAVLIGILPTHETERRLEWLRQNMLYYMPLRKRHPRQYEIKRIALYEPTAGKGKGGISLVADVEGVALMPRSEIQTPWSPSARTQETFLVYRLANLRKLKQPIMNQSGDRVSTERWTSRLALERAQSLNELLLETEPEWRLYELLTSRDFDFSVLAGKIGALNPEHAEGRAVFRVSCRQRMADVLYAGPDGFSIKTRETTNYFPTQEACVAYLDADP